MTFATSENPNCKLFEVSLQAKVPTASRSMFRYKRKLQLQVIRCFATSESFNCKSFDVSLQAKAPTASRSMFRYKRKSQLQVVRCLATSGSSKDRQLIVYLVTYKQYRKKQALSNKNFI